MPKLRVDVAMVARGLVESREMAQRLILAGRVRSGTTVFVKASQTVSEDAELVVSEPERYVSRGGLKLEGALSAFGVDPTGRACLDLGASTGGFTDCLLQHGAASVLAVDVGRAQLHSKLRNDPRVVLLEQTNARALPELEIANDEPRTAARGSSNGEPRTAAGGSSNDEPRTAEGERAGAEVISNDELRIAAGGSSNDEVRIAAGDGTSNVELRTTVGESEGAGDEERGGSKRRSSEFDVRSSEPRNSQFAIRNSISLFVADLSFISLRKVLPSVAGRLAAGTEGIVLLKPQFEAGPKDVPRGGVIKDEAVLERVRREFVEWLEGTGWHVYGMIASPIRGGDGNTEYLVHLKSPENRGSDGTGGTD
ncbi:MAG: TlyA family RNA methyltransferase [Dehalococcoidia bacterium]